VTCLPKDISDHSPLLVESGENFHRDGKRFKIKKWWMERGEFNDLVMRVWNTQYRGSSLVVWQEKTRIFKKMVRGWAANVIAEINKHK
jgi:hypothetical protein